jgi:DNA-binding phage protein
MKAAQVHDDTVVEMLKADPEMVDLYLAAALEEVQLPGGQGALFATLRHIAKAQGQSDFEDLAGCRRSCWSAQNSKS